MAQDRKIEQPLRVILLFERFENKEPEIHKPESEYRWSINDRWCKTEQEAIEEIMRAGFKEAEAKEYLEGLPLQVNEPCEISLYPGQYAAENILVSEWRQGYF